MVVLIARWFLARTICHCANMALSVKENIRTHVWGSRAWLKQPGVIYMQNTFMNPNVAHIISIIAGILILVHPRILNYVVAIYFILMGLVGLVMIS